jgi:DNA-directed RNA polymerase subunit RPC12/RpoP
MIAQMEYVISIAKRYNHARTHYKDPRNRGIKGAKPVLGIYYFNEDGKLRFREVSRFMVPFYRTILWKRRRFVCPQCGSKFLGLIKKDTDIPECPYCGAI